MPPLPLNLANQPNVANMVTRKNTKKNKRYVSIEEEDDGDIGQYDGNNSLVDVGASVTVEDKVENYVPTPEEMQILQAIQKCADSMNTTYRDMLQQNDEMPTTKR